MQEEATIGKQLHAARKRKADEFQTFADGVVQDADRCVSLSSHICKPLDLLHV